MNLWIAYHGDFSGFAVFDEELECLRYAVNNHMLVARVEIGKDIRDQINNEKGITQYG